MLDAVSTLAMAWNADRSCCCFKNVEFSDTAIPGKQSDNSEGLSGDTWSNVQKIINTTTFQDIVLAYDSLLPCEMQDVDGPCDWKMMTM